MKTWYWVLFAGWLAVSVKAAVVEVVNPKPAKVTVKKAPKKKPVKAPVKKPEAPKKTPKFWETL